ncbi:hypothetical protein HCN44_001678 [Aphidius gifuensis]|uniref:Cilia- and flagella-associated protein 36 n=1 Tax=Aphidius gifuensis TaxID=684658 RepID=A0A834XRZ0_APHGI|nr:cilia- and flagella-associated protein 36 [Aphidius gifuensis]KAF7992353.1 hypothetical protein HCN44_001678 [Aphidius gifuensis]
MSESEDSCWVFDSLIGFLQGPIWSSPLLTFIEERSLIFESETEDSQEYREAYQEYKNLVDLLLGCYMEDMEITPEQFEHACAVNKNTKLPMQFQKSLFEQIWAANEYEVFKRMMIQKNLELQLQALSMIEQKFGLTPALFKSSSDSIDGELKMEEIIQKQIQEEDEEEEKNEDDEPKRDETEKNLEKDRERLSNKYENEKAALAEALRVSVSTTSSRSSSPELKYSDESIIQSSSSINNKIKKPAPLAPITYEKIEEIKKTNIGDQEDIKKRENYLKARRDKLVALKKQARSQRLDNINERPCSAKNMAKATMMGKQDLEKSQNSSSILQVRKALAARLKAEVVGSS